MYNLVFCALRSRIVLLMGQGEGNDSLEPLPSRMICNFYLELHQNVRPTRSTWSLCLPSLLSIPKP